MILPKEIVPQLQERVKNQSAYAGLCDSMAVFDSIGWTLEDQPALGTMLDVTHEMGIGLHLMIEGQPVHPRDPYGPAGHLRSQSISQPGRI
jgi:hypothetical protein